MKISSINIFPIKSISWISLNEINVDHFWLQNDRRYVLYKKSPSWEIKEFCRQTEYPSIFTQFSLQIIDNLLKINHKDWDININLWNSFTSLNQTKIFWRITSILWWNDELDEYFSDIIKDSIWIGEFWNNTSYRSKVCPIMLQDRYTVSLLWNKTLDEISKSLSNNILNFRQNITLSTEVPFQEEHLVWRNITLWDISLKITSKIQRCWMINIDAKTWKVSPDVSSTLKEVLKRNEGAKIFTWIWWRFIHSWGNWFNWKLHVWDSLVIDSK